MLIGVISDTHGNIHRTLDAVRVLETFQIEQLLHAGDIGSPSIPALLDRWPGHFVQGNVDEHDTLALQSALESPSQQWHGAMGDIELADRRIALIHSHDARRFRQVIDSGLYDLVCYGHTHVAEQHHEGSTLVLNPGALHRTRMPSCAIVDLQTLTAEIVPLG